MRLAGGYLHARHANGGFPSTYDFVMDTLVPTRIPGVFAYTGHSLITVQSGATLTGSDSGLMRLNGDGTASFVTVVRIVGGTGELAGATGGIVAPGTLNLATGRRNILRRPLRRRPQLARPNGLPPVARALSPAPRSFAAGHTLADIRGSISADSR